MKISIITVCFNSAKTISDTIRSVANQEYPDIEHIIVDGGSTDGTVELIRDASSVASYVSEVDRGIYDAMNKGIAMATGDVVGILNADDFYTSNHVISSIAKVFESPTIDACYADLVYVNQSDTNKVVRYWRSEVFISGAFKRGWMPPHPTFFCRKYVYEENGKFDLNYKIASDVELLFRFLEVKKIQCIYLPELIIKMRLGGTTNKNLNNITFQNKEVLKFLDNYYGKVSRIQFFFCKITIRLKQFIFRPEKLK